MPASALRAQPVETVSPAPAVRAAATPPADFAAAEALPPITHLGAQGPEKIILARLTGIKFVSAADQVVKTGVSLTGVDVSAVPLLRKSDFPEVLKLFLDHPASFESLQRIVVATSTYLEASGYPFLTIYLPQQDITGGAVQVVVTVGRAEDIVKVKGAKYFNERQYRAAIRQRPGEPIDTTDLQADVDWLNRNPFRHVTTIAAPGAKVGSTDLELRVDERLPLRLTAGYNNTGSLVSDEDRVFAGITWGNAFGRGDQLGYQYSASPDARTSVTHSGNYSTDLPWRHTLSVFGAYSELVGRVSAPLSLKGHNGQLGLRYAIPLRPLRPKVTQDLTLGFDFKSSDNNLLFAEFPITDNLTQIAQFTAAYDLGFTDRWGGTSLGVNLFVSPGGLTSRNHGRYFAISRAGARADYVYGQLTAQRQTRLPRGFTWSIRGVLQLSSANLLGSEQMVGGGAGSVRGYEEGEAYGDQGLFVSHEIGLPVKSVTRLFRAARWSDSLQAFAFEDFAVQASKDRLPGERRSTVLHSLGVGLRYQLRQNLSVDLSQGWQLRESGVSRSGDHARTHISVQASY